MRKAERSRRGASSSPETESEYFLYDVDGSLVTRLHPSEASPLGAEWNRVRNSLPNGIYFARARMGGQTVKLANGR